jgi:hypothetical protein
MPPLSNQGVRFLHWLTSKTLRCRHPSTTDSTPAPVTRTQPRTESCFKARRCKPMLRSEGSETAEPQKDKFRCVRPGHPRARTSVAVSDKAQQNDWNGQSAATQRRGDCSPNPTPVTPSLRWSNKLSRCPSNMYSLLGIASSTVRIAHCPNIETQCL